MRRAFVPLVLLSSLLTPACGEPKGSEAGDSETSAGDGDGDGGSCDPELLEQAMPGTSGVFTLRNDRDVTIYVVPSIADCTWEAWQVWDGDTQVYWNDAYVPKCTELRAGDCTWGCSDGAVDVIKLEPGATWEEAWGYYVYTPIELSQACAAGTSCDAGTTCWAGRAKLDGPLQVRIGISEGCVADTCDCNGPACVFQTSSLGVESAADEEITIDFDASSSDVLLAIE